MPTRDSVNRILSVTGSHEKEIVDAGFSGRRGTLTRALVVARMDEYAAAHLLDRQEAAWTFYKPADSSYPQAPPTSLLHAPRSGIPTVDTLRAYQAACLGLCYAIAEFFQGARASE